MCCSASAAPKTFRYMMWCYAVMCVVPMRCTEQLCCSATSTDGALLHADVRPSGKSSLLHSRALVRSCF